MVNRRGFLGLMGSVAVFLSTPIARVHTAVKRRLVLRRGDKLGVENGKLLRLSPEAMNPIATVDHFDESRGILWATIQ